MMDKHVLIVEPDRILATAYGQSLQERGYSVAVARTAQQAVAEADRKLPDVVVLELQLARHNGVEFLYEFKSYTEWQDIPIVVLTSLLPRELARYEVLTKQLRIAAVLRKSETTTALLVRKIDSLLGVTR